MSVPILLLNWDISVEKYFDNYINLVGMKLMSVSSLIAHSSLIPSIFDTVHCISLCISFPISRDTIIKVENYQDVISNDIYSLNILFINVNKSLKIEMFF